MIISRFHFYVFIAALLVYAQTAYRSNGFYHADEHYQIIEFSGLKSGTHTPEQVAWEYKAQIRSALQPALAYIQFRFLNFISIKDPYQQAFVLRLLTGILSLVVISFFIRSTLYLIKPPNQKAFIILSYFLWFLPVINIRFSSETWSGIAFLAGLAILQRTFYLCNKPLVTNYLFSGVCFGFGFLFRYQTALLLLGVLLWLVIVRGINLRYIAFLLLAFLFVTGFGIVLDTWFYNEFTLCFWNYFNVNIIEDAASGFGESPWYYYFTSIVRYATFPIGLLILLALVVLLIKRYKLLFLWIIIPFFVIHTILDHKEERFLFPVVNIIPVCLVIAYQEIRRIIPEKGQKKMRLVALFFLFLLAVINAIGLVSMACKPGGIGRMEISEYIHRNYPYQRKHLIYTKWSNPVNPWQSLPMLFYQEPMRQTMINDLCHLHDSLIQTDAINLLTLRKKELEKKTCSVKIKRLGFEKELQSLPKWLEKINKYYNGFENNDIIVLYSTKRH